MRSSVDAQSILWTDTDVYRRRYEKTATALMAVARALHARRPLAGGEDEFLSLYAALAAADSDTFTTIWEDPFSYFWARLAYELAGWCLNPEPLPAGLRKYCAALGTEEPPRALALHLEEFKKFIIGLEMMTGGTRRFDRPLQTTLPFSIPGTRLSVLGRGTVSVIEVSGIRLDLVFNGATLRLGLGEAASDAAMPRLVQRPLARHGDFELVLKPETFCVPGMDAAGAFLDLAEDYQEQQVSLLQDALALVAQHEPAALEHLGELVKVVAFKPPAAADFSNVSFSDLPGAFILSAVNEPYWMADALIHELLHNRLFFIVDRGEILEGLPEGDEAGEFYSPWRDDLRPLSGLLHAVYVYIGVTKFWFSVCRSEDTNELRREYAADQAVRAILDLKIGIAQLRRFASFTETGTALFRELVHEVSDLANAMPALKLSPGAPAMIVRSDGQIIPFGLVKDGRRLSILETVLAHAEQFDSRRQCADLKAILNAA